jgi:hypothetical protein
MSESLPSPPIENAPCTEEQLLQLQSQRRGRWNWAVINFLLDAVLGCVLVLLLWVALIVQYVFPPGIDAAGCLLWGRDVIWWQNLQFGLLCLFSGLVVVHVMLHWTWICGVLNRQLLGRTVIPLNGTETLVGVILLAAILHLLGIGVVLARWALVIAR